jgi:hypothetical protein
VSSLIRRDSSSRTLVASKVAPACVCEVWEFNAMRTALPRQRRMSCLISRFGASSIAISSSGANNCIVMLEAADDISCSRSRSFAGTTVTPPTSKAPCVSTARNGCELGMRRTTEIAPVGSRSMGPRSKPVLKGDAALELRAGIWTATVNEAGRARIAPISNAALTCMARTSSGRSSNTSFAFKPPATGSSFGGGAVLGTSKGGAVTKLLDASSWGPASR